MDNVRYAGFWRRFAALMLDGVIIGVPVWIGIFLMFGGMAGIMKTQFSHPMLFQLIGCVLPIVYYVWFLSSPWQATPGKRIMGVYVIRAEDGGRLSAGRALTRYVVFDAATLLFLLFSIFVSNPFPSLPEEDQQRFASISAQEMRHETPAPEDQQFMQHMTDEMQRNNMTQAGISAEDQERFLAIQQKLYQHQVLTAEEEKFFEQITKKMTAQYAKTGGVGMLAGLYALVIALMVGMTRQKTGLHDMLCKTRALRGRSDAPMAA